MCGRWKCGSGRRGRRKGPAKRGVFTYVRRLLLLLCLCAASLSFGQVVCIDPGHPSEVGVGTQGKKLTELKAVWVQAQMLKQRLEKRGIKVVMTKPTMNKMV